jgi:DedD protein
MARSISDEELQLRKRARRRLVGAIALVTVAVVVVPMVLDDKPKPVGQDIAIRIPSQEGNDFSSKVIPPIAKKALHTAPVAANVESALPKSAESQPVSPAPVKPVEKDVAILAAPPPQQSVKPTEKAPPPAKSEALEKAETVQKHAPAAKSGGYVVLLGAFSNQVNAKQRQAKLSALGIKFYTEKLKTAVGEKIGVRAGPYPSRHEAEQVRDKLKVRGIQDGIVAEKAS